MCRLFGAISNQPIDAKNLLFSAPQSLFIQSRVDHKRPQGDGWGAGWFKGGKPCVLKSARPMYREKNNVRLAGERASGRVLIGHVRWASNPLKLKRSKLIGLPHTQPFIHGKWLFAHNGTLFIPKEVTAHLGSLRKYIKGKNDSEVLFYWLLKHLAGPLTPTLSRKGRGDIKNAVRKAISGLHRIWKTCKKSYPIHPYPYHGLNWVLSNGRTLIAFCYTDPRGFGKSKALCDKKDRYYQLRKRVSPDQVLIASEPLDHVPDWDSFRHGELLIASRKGGRLVTKTMRIL